jgi:hypothetical protein
MRNKDKKSKKDDVLKNARKSRLKLLEEKKKKLRKLRKLRLKYLKKARNAKLIKEERSKIKKHDYYFRHKLKETCMLWRQRIKDKLSSITKKVPGIMPEPRLDVKEITGPRVAEKTPTEQRKLQKQISLIDEEIKELNKPINIIKKDVRAKKKDIKRMLSPKIYQKTRELITLEEKEKNIRKKLENIRRQDR